MSLPILSILDMHQKLMQTVKVLHYFNLITIRKSYKRKKIGLNTYKLNFQIAKKVHLHQRVKRNIRTLILAATFIDGIYWDVRLIFFSSIHFSIITWKKRFPSHLYNYQEKKEYLNKPKSPVRITNYMRFLQAPNFQTSFEWPLLGDELIDGHWTNTHLFFILFIKSKIIFLLYVSLHFAVEFIILTEVVDGVINSEKLHNIQDFFTEGTLGNHWFYL